MITILRQYVENNRIVTEYTNDGERVLYRDYTLLPSNDTTNIEPPLIVPDLEERIKSLENVIVNAILEGKL